MKKIFDLIISYKFVLIKIIYYEILYIFSGYKGNFFSIRNNVDSTDTIPCSYYFLSIIYKKIKDRNIRSFIDLGCGNGRVLYFFNKKLKINYVGVELFRNSYDNCLKIFKNSSNINIINKNFFDLNFKETNLDCYFLNDPLKRVEDHNKLIRSIISTQAEINKKALFILVNLTDGKYDIFRSCKLLYDYKINSRNIRIYSTQ